jgi:hypothetical protein
MIEEQLTLTKPANQATAGVLVAKLHISLNAEGILIRICRVTH